MRCSEWVLRGRDRTGVGVLVPFGGCKYSAVAGTAVQGASSSVEYLACLAQPALRGHLRHGRTSRGYFHRLQQQVPAYQYVVAAARASLHRVLTSSGYCIQSSGTAALCMRKRKIHMFSLQLSLLYSTGNSPVAPQPASCLATECKGGHTEKGERQERKLPVKNKNPPQSALGNRPTAMPQKNKRKKKHGTATGQPSAGTGAACHSYQ